MSAEPLRRQKQLSHQHSALGKKQQQNLCRVAVPLMAPSRSLILQFHHRGFLLVPQLDAGIWVCRRTINNGHSALLPLLLFILKRSMLRLSQIYLFYFKRMCIQSVTRVLIKKTKHWNKGIYFKLLCTQKANFTLNLFSGFWEYQLQPWLVQPDVNKELAAAPAQFSLLVLPSKLKTRVC